METSSFTDKQYKLWTKMAYKEGFYFLIIITILTFFIFHILLTDHFKQLPINVRTSKVTSLNISHEQVNIKQIKNGTKELKLKYILQWTNPYKYPFVIMDKGQKSFIERNCTYLNCYVTSNKTYLGDYTKFDVIAFDGTEIKDLVSLPKRRSAHQKYVFGTMESADNYPICYSKFDDFFNWTWTYRLASEVHWGYITVRDKNNNIVGPNEIMYWKRIEDMDPVSPELRKELRTKSKSAAWFVSNCRTRSKRENYVKELQKELNKYHLYVDIYGRCGKMKCDRNDEQVCHEIIKKDYYFYLSFENSFSEDYVTEKLLRALQNNAVPVVYGGANYTRFMPDGIYLNARDLRPADLASKMYELMHDPEQYIQYFKWKNHYSYHRKRETIETDQYCLFCSTLNDEEMVKKITIYEQFREWWDPLNRCKEPGYYY